MEFSCFLWQTFTSKVLNIFKISEKYLSLIPALQLLNELGSEFLTAAEALRNRLDRGKRV